MLGKFLGIDTITLDRDRQRIATLELEIVRAKRQMKRVINSLDQVIRKLQNGK